MSTGTLTERLVQELNLVEECLGVPNDSGSVARSTLERVRDFLTEAANEAQVFEIARDEYWAKKKGR